VSAVGVRPPGHDRILVRIVVREVVRRQVYRQASGLVSVIFGLQGQAVVLGMACFEDPAAIGRSGDVGSGFVGHRQELEPRGTQNILGLDPGMPGMRGQEDLVEAPKQGFLEIERLVAEEPKHLFRQGMLLYPVMVIEARLGAQQTCRVDQTCVVDQSMSRTSSGQ